MVFHYIQTEGTKVITQSNLYNGNGQRVQKQEGDNTINYFYQGNNVLYTTNGDGNKTSHNFIGLEGNTISTIRYNLAGLEYYIYNKDIKGSISNLVDNNGNAKISYTYSDFGETEEVGDTIFYNEIAYTGGIYDENTSLYYLNARYYNPEDARFITQDTYRGEVNNPSSLYLYTYCYNNPINYIDPSGHVAKWWNNINPSKGLSKKAKYKKYNLLSKCKKGDIVYEQKGGYGVTGHIGIIEGIFKDKKHKNSKYVRIIEATNSGVNYGVLDDERMLIKKDFILRTKKNCNKTQVINFCKKQLNKPYNWYVWQKKTSEKSESWYCSEMVWAAYKTQGIDLERKK